MSAALTRKLRDAQHRLEQRDIAGAQYLCQQVLERAPRNPDALYLLALIHLSSGNGQAAIPLLEQITSTMPRNGAALDNLGFAYLTRGRFQDAERVLRAASSLPGAPGAVFMRLGVALLNQAQYAEAIGSLEHARTLAPTDPDTYLNLAQAYARAGQPAQARQALESVLRIAPGRLDALFNLGVIALEQEQLEDATRWFTQVLDRAPQHADAIVNLGIVLQRSGRLDDAVQAFERALKIDPALAPAAANLGQTLAMQGHLDRARQMYREAVRLAPGLMAAHEGLAVAASALGRYKEAIPCTRAVLAAEPGNVGMLATLAEALFQTAELGEAEAVARRAIGSSPSAPSAYQVLANVHSVRGEIDRMIAVLDAGHTATQSPELLGMLCYELRRICDWDRWLPLWPRLSAMLDQNRELAGAPFSLLCQPTSAQQQLTYARRWTESKYRASLPLPAKKETSARPRVKIGYLSGDFHQHAVAYLVAEVLELHDRDNFEIYAYSTGPDDKSATRERLRAGCEHFVDVAWDPDDVSANRIRDDDLDILVDLKGYTVGARIGVLARRPCAVQINWLGYPGTMGAEFMDYIIADSYIVPPGDEAAYSERVLRMPHCYQPNDRKRVVSETRPRSEYGLKDDQFVFCCFNQSSKVSPEIFSCWMDLLTAIPQSVLWLLEDNRWASENLKAAARARGINAERIVLAPRLPLPDHLARYRTADLALDTLPYTSHTTASDALWAGCPLVALRGDTFAARVSGSILTAGGLPELIAETTADYFALAKRIASDASYRKGIRTRLNNDVSSSPLFDSAGFASNLENLYRAVLKHPPS